jgi:hypothetical protein
MVPRKFVFLLIFVTAGIEPAVTTFRSGDTVLKAQLAMKNQSFQLMIPTDGETITIK